MALNLQGVQKGLEVRMSCKDANFPQLIPDGCKEFNNLHDKLRMQIQYASVVDITNLLQINKSPRISTDYCSLPNDQILNRSMCNQWVKNVIKNVTQDGYRMHLNC